jgi:hypothetical protein
MAHQRLYVSVRSIRGDHAKSSTSGISPTAMIDEIAATDNPALLAMKGNVIVRKPIAIPEGSVASAKATGLGPFATRFGLSEEIKCLISRVVRKRRRT